MRQNVPPRGQGSGKGLPAHGLLPKRRKVGLHRLDGGHTGGVLIPALMQVVLLGMRQSLGDNAAVLDPVTALLGEALREPVANLPADRVAKLVRRSKRVTTQAMMAITDKTFGVQYLGIARFTADLTERGVLVVGSESPFAQAWDMMAEVIGLGWDELEKCQTEASDTANELGRILAGMGFLRTDRNT